MLPSPEALEDVTDMARGAGGRMSTTRFGDAGSGTRANTGAQYVSCCSDDAAALLKKVCADNGSERKCGVDLVPVPERRSTHFLLGPDSSYAHLLPHDGTNALVKQFLYHRPTYRRSSPPLAAHSLPRGRRGRRRAALNCAVTEAPPRKASIRPTKPRPLPPAPIPPPPCSPSPPRGGRKRHPRGPRNSLPPSEGAGLRRTPRAPHFPSHSGHSSDRWSSDPGDAPRA